MNIDDVFQSAYLKGTDLLGKGVVFVTIESVTMEDFDDDGEKLVAAFLGTEKTLVLNKTNARAIGDIYGPETDDWSGQEIGVYHARVEYRGKLTDAVRIAPPADVDVAGSPLEKSRPSSNPF